MKVNDAVPAWRSGYGQPRPADLLLRADRAEAEIDVEATAWHRAGMEHARVNGVELAYEVSGTGAPVLLIGETGMPAVGWQFLQAPALVAAGVPDTGGLDTDLFELSRRNVSALNTQPARLALPGLLADLHSDPALRQRFDREVIAAQRALVQLVLDRAADRGELSKPAGATDLHAQLLGTAYAWTSMFGEPTPPDLAERMARAAHAAILAKDADDALS